MLAIVSLRFARSVWCITFQRWQTTPDQSDRSSWHALCLGVFICIVGIFDLRQSVPNTPIFSNSQLSTGIHNGNANPRLLCLAPKFRSCFRSLSNALQTHDTWSTDLTCDPDHFPFFIFVCAFVPGSWVRPNSACGSSQHSVFPLSLPQHSRMAVSNCRSGMPSDVPCRSSHFGVTKNCYYLEANLLTDIPSKGDNAWVNSTPIPPVCCLLEMDMKFLSLAFASTWNDGHTRSLCTTPFDLALCRLAQLIVLVLHFLLVLLRFGCETYWLSHFFGVHLLQSSTCSHWFWTINENEGEMLQRRRRNRFWIVKAVEKEPKIHFLQ